MHLALLCLLAAVVAAFALHAPAYPRRRPRLRSLSRAPAAVEAQHAPPTLLVLDVKGAIGPATTEYLAHGLDAAAARKAVAIVIRIDTPGGLVSSTREIIQAMLASPVPVIAYVAPGGAQAASAGTYIVYASHLAAMAPGTNIGAATVVTMVCAIGTGTEQITPTDKERTGPGQPNSTGQGSRSGKTEGAAKDRGPGADGRPRSVDHGRVHGCRTQGHQRCGRIHPQPGGPARPQRQMGRASRA